MTAVESRKLCLKAAASFLDPQLSTQLKNERPSHFWECVLICRAVRVGTTAESAPQFLQYTSKPWRNASCSSCVHLPLFPRILA